VGDLEASKALLPAVGGLGCGVSKVLVQGADGFCEDLEAFEFVRAELSEELGGVCEREGGADAGHNGGSELCGPTDELGACNSETNVSVWVIVVTLFKVVDEGF
jgi:hypothetical protein